MEKVDNMKEQMCNIRELEILRKNQKEMLEIKNTITAMNNAFDNSIRRLLITEKRISVLKDMSTETSKTEKQNKSLKKKKSQNGIPRTITNDVTYA